MRHWHLLHNHTSLFSTEWSVKNKACCLHSTVRVVTVCLHTECTDNPPESLCSTKNRFSFLHRFYQDNITLDFLLFPHLTLPMRCHTLPVASLILLRFSVLFFIFGRPKDKLPYQEHTEIDCAKLLAAIPGLTVKSVSEYLYAL